MDDTEITIHSTSTFAIQNQISLNLLRGPISHKHSESRRDHDAGIHHRRRRGADHHRRRLRHWTINHRIHFRLGNIVWLSLIFLLTGRFSVASLVQSHVSQGGKCPGAKFALIRFLVRVDAPDVRVHVVFLSESLLTVLANVRFLTSVDP